MTSAYIQIQCNIGCKVLNKYVTTSQGHQRFFYPLSTELFHIGDRAKLPVRCIVYSDDVGHPRRHCRQFNGHTRPASPSFVTRFHSIV